MRSVHGDENLNSGSEWAEQTRLPEVMMIANQNKVVDRMIRLYQKRARYYDFTAGLYRLIGFREWKYRKMAVEALGLHPGDTVVEIGCGTGLNFSLLEEAVGPKGKIIGVDLTDAMLDQAQKRIAHHGWSNIELVHGNAAIFEFSSRVDGIISTFAITFVPEYDQVIQHGAEALAVGKRWVVLDLKLPGYIPSWLAPLLVLLIRPFVASDEYLTRRPWESLREHLEDTTLHELFMKFAYIAIGEHR